MMAKEAFPESKGGLRRTVLGNLNLRSDTG